MNLELQNFCSGFDLFLTPIKFDTFCDYSYQGIIDRNLKLNPKFGSHQKVKKSDDVRKLRIMMKPSNEIFAGIGEAFRNLEKLNLGEISTGDGTIEFIERADFANMKNLKELGLNQNPLRFLPEEAFWDLPALEGLHLWNCKIAKLPKNLLINLKNLKKFFLGQNKVQHIDKDFFKNNLLLERVNLFGNKLKIIDVDFTKLPKLNWFSVYGNECVNDRYTLIDKNYSTALSVQEIQDKINQYCRKGVNTSSRFTTDKSAQINTEPMADRLIFTD